ncbi:MAG: hypothetical protein LBU82_04340 [Treponema sp.]|jgi:predicted  nucleic acid-binding Zn-ribbon protein|nr:hypothetical protein [Treponema sp.]
MTNDDIIINPNSGISVEEQKEILERIDGITERNRRSLQEGSSGGKLKIEAKKNGALFPVLVNIAALIILFGGGFILISFNSVIDAQAREGGGTYILAGRALEESRAREAELLARLDEKNAEVELYLLANGQKEAAAIDAQLAGGLAVVNRLVRENKLEQAAAANKDLTAFLKGGAFASSLAYQEKKDFYAQTFESISALIEEVRRNRSGAVIAEMEQLKTGNTQLEEALAEREKAIEAYSSDSTSQARRITELERTVAASNSSNASQTRRITELESSVSSLRSANSGLEASITEKDKNIRALENEKTTLAQTISARDATIKELQSGSLSMQQEIERLSNQIADIRRALQELSQQ